MNKTVLITGASSGIGYEFAKIYASKGYDLVLVARNQTKLAELQIACKTTKNKVEIISKDLSQINSANEIFDYCITKNIRVDYLINNAGFGDFGFFAQSNWGKQQEMLNVNIITLTNLTHLFLPKMVENKFGKILNVASTAAFQPGPLMSVYYATKAYVLSFTEAISNELEGTGVSVCALCPGPTESGFLDAAALQESKLFKGKKLATSKEVAQFGYNSLENNKVVAIHGLINKIMATAIRFTPRGLVRKMVRYIQSKEKKE
jgi:short-subunit dehydrogenase